MNSRILRISILGGVAWAIVAASGPLAQAFSSLRIGDPVPDFSLARADGSPGEVSLDHLKGTPSVIVFWRPRQELSLSALRDLCDLRDELGAERWNVVAVDSSRSSADDVRTALGGEQITFPVVLDPQREFYGKVGVIVSPTTLLLDPEGRLRFKVASHPSQYKLVVRARLQYMLGDIDEDEMSRAIEPTVLKVDQDLAAAWRMYNLGRKLQGEGKPQQAADIFEQAVSRYPSLPETRCALGFMKLDSGDLDGAAQQFQAALATQPNAPLARLGQAVVLARTGAHDASEQVLLSLLGNKPIAVRVRYELGRLYRIRGEDQKALVFFEDALSTMFPEHAVTAESTGSEQSSMPAITSEASPIAAGETLGSPAEAPVVDVPMDAVEPIVPPAGAQYLGIKGCKKCHFQQWKSWRDTNMASAFDLLKPEVRPDVKRQRGLDPGSDYTEQEECLRCHTTGYGYPGGYDASSVSDGRAMTDLAAVGCESCHGPGDGFVELHEEIQDNKRSYSRSEFYAAGQYEVGVAVCVGCHNGSAPCIAPGVVFDFEARKGQGTHRHYELMFRSD